MIHKNAILPSFLETSMFISMLLDIEGKTANILVKIVITNDTIIIIKDFSFDFVTSIDIDVFYCVNWLLPIK